jgi:hypothetical protein
MNIGRQTTTVLLLCGLCLGLGYAFGRQTDADPAPGGVHLRELDAALDLRTDQMAAIDKLLARHDAEVQALVDSHREALRKPLEESLSRTEQAMLALLDDDQRDRYHELNRD